MRVRGKSRGDGEGGKNYGGGGHPNDFDNILQLSSNSSTYGHHTNRRPFQNHATFGILLLNLFTRVHKDISHDWFAEGKEDCVEECGRL